MKYPFVKIFMIGVKNSLIKGRNYVKHYCVSYNRKAEVPALLESLTQQTSSNFRSDYCG